jgi:hypothetical protein
MALVYITPIQKRLYGYLKLLKMEGDIGSPSLHYFRPRHAPE